MLHLAFDAAYPPESPYPGAQAVMGYIGGNTPHVWSNTEWLRFQHLRQFPIWVGYHDSDPERDANVAVQRTRDMGWIPSEKNARAIILDFETEVNASWIATYARIVFKAGYQTIMYGSESTVVNDPVRGGRWIALYDGTEDIPSVAGAIGHQFRADVPWNGTQVDLSVITDAMMAHSGGGPRHPLK